MLKSATTMCVTVWIFAACGGDSGDGELGALDCAFVESDNCYKQLVDEIALCAPDPELTGTFNAERTECVYTDGVRVAFDEPVPATLPDDHDWRLTVFGADGSTCVRWDEAPAAANEINLAITAGPDQLTVAGDLDGIVLTCPDGSAFFTDDPLSVITGCTSERQFGLPVTTIRQSPGFIGLAIALGEEPDGRDIEVDLFACSDAP